MYLQVPPPSRPRRLSAASAASAASALSRVFTGSARGSRSSSVSSTRSPGPESHEAPHAHNEALGIQSGRLSISTPLPSHPHLAPNQSSSVPSPNSSERVESKAQERFGVVLGRVEDAASGEKLLHAAQGFLKELMEKDEYRHKGLTPIAHFCRWTLTSNVYFTPPPERSKDMSTGQESRFSINIPCFALEGIYAPTRETLWFHGCGYVDVTIAPEENYRWVCQRGYFDKTNKAEWWYYRVDEQYSLKLEGWDHPKPDYHTLAYIGVQSPPGFTAYVPQARDNEKPGPRVSSNLKAYLEGKLPLRQSGRHNP